MTRAMTSEEAIAIAAGKLKAQSDGRPFRWTPRRDRELQQLRDDLFTFAECAKILGGGCTPDQAKARMAELRKDGVAGAPSEVVGGDQHAPLAAGARAEGDPLPPRPRPDEIHESEVRYEPQAPLRPVIGPDFEPEGPRATEGGRPSTAVPRPAKLQLPRYGEMEKRYDRIAREDLR